MGDLSKGISMTERRDVATWRIIAASLLDFFTVFLLGGYLVGWATGSLTDEGFDLSGWPAAMLLALVVAYFVIAGRTIGGTLWQRILRAKR
jgi:hypothetical protein